MALNHAEILEMGADLQGTDATDDIALLQALLEAPPQRASQLAPIALRSVAAQRDAALRGFLRRTWVDHVLKHAERVLLVGALIVFGGWLADGPVRDWLHAQREQAAPAEAAPVAVAPVLAAAQAPTLSKPAASPVPASVEPVAAPLPFVSSAMERTAPAEDFIAPRQAVPQAPLSVSPLPTHLIVPAISLDTPIKETFVVDGVWEVADYAAGYMHGTALPGESGNTALAGHAGIRGSVFRDLGELKPGDDVYLDAGGWRYHYRVRSTTNVWPTQVEVLAPTVQPILTMLTCTNWDTQRMVVVADLVDSKPSPSA